MSLEGLALWDEVPVGHKGDGTKVPKVIVETRRDRYRAFCVRYDLLRNCFGSRQPEIGT